MEVHFTLCSYPRSFFHGHIRERLHEPCRDNSSRRSLDHHLFLRLRLCSRKNQQGHWHYPVHGRRSLRLCTRSSTTFCASGNADNYHSHLLDGYCQHVHGSGLHNKAHDLTIGISTPQSHPGSCRGGFVLYRYFCIYTRKSV